MYHQLLKSLPAVSTVALTASLATRSRDDAECERKDVVGMLTDLDVRVSLLMLINITLYCSYCYYCMKGDISHSRSVIFQ